VLNHKSLRRKAMACAAMVAAALVGLSTSAVAAPQVGVQALDELIGSAHGTVLRGSTPSGTPMLARFQYHYASADHHIRSVAAMPLPQQSAVEITFADENSDDEYSYRVSHEKVDPTGIVQGTFHGTCTGQCSVLLNTRPSTNSVFVLTGFRFAYNTADHHLDKIAVSAAGSVLTTAFRDQNGDDPYTYDVSYAWVPRNRFGTVAEILSTVHASGITSPVAASGEKVIRGFFVDNLATGDAGDNHIKDLGVVANANSFDVLFGDENPANSADWRYQVQYAVLL